MIPLGGFVVGAGLGAWRAWKNKGKSLDIAQYAGAYGILFAIVALFVNVFVLRALL